ncbi:GDSL esterase/lipase At5g03600-like [Triticum aestivum]|uniref:GDSL esterase/lipase n=1 Tax=Triticum turgidum subsp. durum TaxID=4567 RepID=A0A9R1P7C9_TRITD|nr:GDSL esterase/lipase At5g03600-like [Triticum aestivum]VAH37855.1 unnamed protein product [Triticum turgidum subsp. durum]
MITVGEQVDLFESMVKSGTISKNRVTHSVALLAISGNDYKTYYDAGILDLTPVIEGLGNQTVAIVDRLRALGVKRILVNNLHPIGCTPLWSRASKYKECDYIGNNAALQHNKILKQKLGRKKGVLIVDLNTAFGNIIDHGSKSYKQFKNTRKPCCEGYRANNYCGRQAKDYPPLYSLCPDRSQFFFWDDAHPTHAGWETVMKQLEHPIKKFLGIV